MSFTAVLRCGESFSGASHPSSEKQLSTWVPAVGLFGGFLGDLLFFCFGFVGFFSHCS